MVAAVANVSYALLDRAVIAGAADDPLLVGGPRSWTHARLLEEVAAIGGVLRHLGAAPGEPVLLDLAPEHDLEAVVAALAAARLGAVVTRPSAGPADVRVVVCSGGSDVLGPGDTPRLVRGTDAHVVSEPDLDWSVMLRAGRTDPAPCAVLTPDAPYSTERDVAEQVRLLEAEPAPYHPASLRALLQA